MTTEEIRKEMDKMSNAKVAYRQSLEKYIKERLAENENFIDFTDLEDSVCVSYDGGGHPEYATNLYSNAYNVQLNGKGDIILETEDDPEYHIDRCSLEDVESVACGIASTER